MQTATARPASLAAAVARSAADRDALRSAFARMKAAHRSLPMPSHEQRIARLDKLLGIIREYRTEIAEAISDDFGHRSAHETQLAEIVTLVSVIRSLKLYL
jgi:coniferyl-aldehyde dehydrogenase